MEKGEALRGNLCLYVKPPAQTPPFHNVIFQGKFFGNSEKFALLKRVGFQPLKVTLHASINVFLKILRNEKVLLSKSQ